MILVRQDQLDDLTEGRLYVKLRGSFSRSLPEFADWEEGERRSFLLESVEAARARGFRTEIGIASYAMAVWWLNFGFDESSAALKQVLESDLPEIRRVHMMNEWVSARLAAPDDPGPAERALADARELTAPWGKR